MNKKYELSITQENCLRVIYEVEQTQKIARVKDLSQKLKISNSSVCQILKQLNGNGMVRYQPYELPILSEEGSEAARSLYLKYHLIEKLLKNGLGVEPEEAREVACCLEHVLSSDLKKNMEVLYRTITGEQLVKNILLRELAAAGSDL